MRQYYPLMPANGDQGPAGGEQGPPERPDYKVYRSRPGLLSRLRSPDLATLRERLRAKGPAGPARREESRERPEAPKERPPWRRVLKWVGIAALAWLVLSFLAFAVSSQIQKGKLADMGDTLGGNPFMLGFPQTVLVLGTDVRPSGLAATGEDTPQKCIDAAGEGKTPPSSCSPYRADTIMLVRAGPVRLSQALDPARHLRLDPGPRRPEDQRRLRLWRRQARGPDRGAVPGHRRRPGRRGRLQRLPRLHRRDRGRDGGHRHEGLLGDLGRGGERRLQPLPRSGGARPQRGRGAEPDANAQEPAHGSAGRTRARRSTTSIAPSSSRTSCRGSRAG